MEQNVPYATFFRSAMPVVNGTFSNTFVEQRAVQSTVQSADESVPREPPVIVAKPQGATDVETSFSGRRWTVTGHEADSQCW